MKIYAAGYTDIGRKRPSNQDSYVVDEATGFYAVADGLGGTAGGELAAEHALRSVHRRVQIATRRGAQPREAQAMALLLEEATARAGRQIFHIGQEHRRYHRMATTLTALYLGPGYGLLAHVGDSRLYRYRRGVLRQLTQDHSVVGELVRNGAWDAEKARRSRIQHILTRSLGRSPEVEVDVRSFKLQDQDTFLLCSDGLYRYWGQEELRGELASRLRDLPSLGPHLLQAANQRGGQDNITAVVVHVDKVEASPQHFIPTLELHPAPEM